MGEYLRMVKRIVTAIFLIPAAVLAILKGGPLFFAVVLLLNLLSLHEFNGMFPDKEDFLGLKFISFFSTFFLIVVFCEKMFRHL